MPESELNREFIHHIKPRYDFAEVAHWSFDVVGDRLDWSEEACLLFTGAPGHRFTTVAEAECFIHPDDCPQVRHLIDQTLATKSRLDLEHRVIHVDGSERWIHAQGNIVYRHGIPQRMMGVMQDITQRKQAEIMLRNEHEFMNVLLNQAPAMVMATDVTGAISYVNPLWEEVHGYSFDEAKGKDLIELLIPASYRRETYQKLNRALQGEAFEGQVCDVVTKSGGLLKIEWSANLLKDDAGGSLGILIIGQDMTEKHRLHDQLKASEERFRGLVEMNHDWIWEVGRDGNYSYVSPQVERILGRKPQEMIGKSPFDFMPPEEGKRISAWFESIAAEHLPIIKKENINLHKKGHELVMETSARPFFDEHGNFCGYRGVDRDVTVRAKYRQEHELSTLVLEHTPEGVMITDADLNIIKINPAFTQMTGYSEQEILGKHPRVLSSKRHGEAFYRTMWATIKAKGHWQGEIWNRRKDGEIYPEWLNISSICDSAGRVDYYAAIFSDISSQNQIRNQLHNLAYYDSLTGLPNRELFQDRLNKTLQQAKRNGDIVSVMFLDLDHFKRVNDSLGHKIGDLLLKQVGDVLSRCVRASDTVARLGGDEFTIMLSGNSQLESVARVADKIIEALDAPFELEEGLQTYASVSIGISHYPVDGADVETLLKNADNAMYRAKDRGRHTYEFFTAEMNERATERLLLEQDLRQAIQDEQLTLAYQPQVDINSGKVLGFEALLRWHHEDRGWVSPSQFIPIAEEAGLIGRLGDWVLDQAVSQLAEWHKDYDTDLRMAVNISAQQLYMNDLPGQVTALLECYQVPASSLELELTESSLIENVEHASRVLKNLRALGVELALDDFGTGYSSLSYLKQFKVDRLKVDKSFVTDISTDTSDAEIVVTIIAMANSLKLKVIAEGVETQAQAAFLQYHGCNEAQGFYYSHPITADRASAILMRGGQIVEPLTD